MFVSLIGYRGTGKTTIGSALADRLNLSLVDSDVEIVERAGKTIADIFADDGENAFRNIESQVVNELMKLENGIVSWGGGVVLKDANREQLKSKGVRVWLTASAETLHDRIHGDGASAANRPALSDLSPLEEIQSQLNKRHSMYADVATTTIDTEGKSIEGITSEIVAYLNRCDLQRN